MRKTNIKHMGNVKIKIELEIQPGGRGGHYCAPCSQIFKNDRTDYVFEVDFQSADNYKKFNDILDIRYKFYNPETFKGGFRLCIRHKKKLVELIKQKAGIKFTTNKFNKGENTTRWFEINFEIFLEVLVSL
ncbi:MAG: hypothetical protein NT085_00765 [candidate division SR1 bacterium]|nr:hypothetical protein [candidate division SR1 bacterium]